MGRTNAPTETSLTASETVSAFEADFAGKPNDVVCGRLVRITLAKWVGTAMLGGLPIISYDLPGWRVVRAHSQRGDEVTHDAPLSIWALGGQVKRYPTNPRSARHSENQNAENSRKNINILKVARQPTTEILDVRPVVAIKPFAYLRRDIRQVKCFVHCFLGCF